ncbi:hypothetical protein [Halalkalibacter flavus]|uniref:hypothetical protein n=1 Tax=Halalkalibacter flavus TaxID=3090668 RepID=UPI002FC7F84D
MEWKPIRVRLRSGKDDDIAKALQEAEKTEDRSDIVRKALREHLCGMRPQPRHVELEPIDDFVLEQKEKADEEIHAGLDNLLGEF